MYIVTLVIVAAASFIAGARYGRRALAEEISVANKLAQIREQAEKRLAMAKASLLPLEDQFKKAL